MKQNDAGMVKYLVEHPEGNFNLEYVIGLERIVLRESAKLNQVLVD